VRAVREVTSALASADWPDKHETQQRTITEIVRQIQRQGALQASEPHSDQSLEHLMVRSLVTFDHRRTADLSSDLSNISLVLVLLELATQSALQSEDL
jgi:hypothetical protein